MSILIFAIVVLILAALLVWACDYLPMPAPIGGIVRFLIIVVAVLIILNRTNIV